MAKPHLIRAHKSMHRILGEMMVQGQFDGIPLSQRFMDVSYGALMDPNNPAYGRYRGPDGFQSGDVVNGKRQWHIGEFKAATGDMKSNVNYDAFEYVPLEGGTPKVVDRGRLMEGTASHFQKALFEIYRNNRVQFDDPKKFVDEGDDLLAVFDKVQFVADNMNDILAHLDPAMDELNRAPLEMGLRNFVDGELIATAVIRIKGETEGKTLLARCTDFWQTQARINVFNAFENTKPHRWGKMMERHIKYIEAIGEKVGKDVNLKALEDSFTHFAFWRKFKEYLRTRRP